MIKKVLSKITRFARNPFDRAPVVASSDIHRFEQVLYSVRVPPRTHGRALLTYLVEPFEIPLSSEKFRTHTNRWRSVAIAEALCSRGFVVDVTSWRNPSPPSGKNYDLILGLGPAFAKSVAERVGECRALYLGTGAAPEQTNAALERRGREFVERHGKAIKVGMLDPDRGPGLADRMIIVGNQWTAETYGPFSKAPISFCGNSLVEGVVDTRALKDFSAARRNFVWMAAYGALRRKLDLVLEAFSLCPELDLWICGGIEWEKDFCSIMGDWLFRTPNIHLVGWVDVASQQYQDVTSRCGYILYPSVSDGMPGSVVNAMGSGVVPLVTLEAGIDVKPFGTLFQADSVDDIIHTIRTAAERSEPELEAAAGLAVEEARVGYCRDVFVSQFDATLNAAGLPLVAAQNG